MDEYIQTLYIYRLIVKESLRKNKKWPNRKNKAAEMPEKKKDHHWGRGGEVAKTPGSEKVTYTGSVPGRT